MLPRMGRSGRLRTPLGRTGLIYSCGRSGGIIYTHTLWPAAQCPVRARQTHRRGHQEPPRSRQRTQQQETCVWPRRQAWRCNSGDEQMPAAALWVLCGTRHAARSRGWRDGPSPYDENISWRLHAQVMKHKEKSETDDPNSEQGLPLGEGEENGPGGGQGCFWGPATGMCFLKSDGRADAPLVPFACTLCPHKDSL